MQDNASTSTLRIHSIGRTIIAMRALMAILCAVGAFAWNGGEVTDAVCSSPHCLALPVVSVAPPLQLTQCAKFRDRGATWYVLGYVLNTSDKPIYNAMVKVSDIDFNGSLVSSTVPLALPATLPGQLNPYEAQFFPGLLINPKSEVISYTTNSTLTVNPITVVTSRTVEIGKVVATFRNDTLNPVHSVQALIGTAAEGMTCWSFIPPDWAGGFPANPPYAIAPLINPGETITYTFPVANSTQRWVIFAEGVVSP